MENKKFITIGAWLEYNKALNRYRVRYTDHKGETYSLARSARNPNGGYRPVKVEHHFKWKWVAKKAERHLHSKLRRGSSMYIKNLDKWEKVVD